MNTDNNKSPKVEVLEDSKYGIPDPRLFFAKYAGSSHFSIKDAWNNSSFGAMCNTLLRGAKNFDRELDEIKKATDVIDAEVLNVEVTVRPTKTENTLDL